ncbi:MAG: MetQ/NlpA family ABC transporter substrate-binding protein [Tissierellia bacterium]|nr:MetQ/NlpA family ABC transporter substrate-binding protein [Tissierellia bacterium]MDD4781641.1 MetQ/NlpA family ABC transporter substrate-binding protein [Tissierellia bacterium]
MKNLKKLLIGILVLALALGTLTACQNNEPAEEPKEVEEQNEEKNEEQEKQASGGKITVAASPTPHAEILAQVKDVLAEQGYELEVIEYSDYIQPNLVVDSGEIVANFFQHKPYLDNFNEENKTKLVPVASIHYEPLAIYPGKSSDLANIPEGGAIAVPNDTTNEARALLLLETNGLIKLREDAGLLATKNDIVDNPKNIEIVELEAAQVSRVIDEVDFVVLNGNYALNAGLKVADAVAQEEQESEAAQTYANVIVVKEGNENREDVKALIEALKSEEIKQYIADTYEGAVVAID